MSNWLVNALATKPKANMQPAADPIPVEPVTLELSWADCAPSDEPIARLVATLDPGLIERFHERAAIREYDGQLDRWGAERVALGDLLPYMPAGTDANTWNALAALWPISGADPRAWATGLLDRLDGAGGLYWRVSWETFRKLESMERGL